MLSFITWQPNPEVFHWGSVELRWYGVCFSLAFIMGNFILRKVLKQEGLTEDNGDKMLTYMIVSTVIGARLGHCFFYEWYYYKDHLLEILMPWKGGLSSHGTTVGILLGLWLFVHRVVKRPYLWVTDRVTLVIALGGAAIRIGNLFNSEIFGHVTNFPWGFRFVNAEGPDALPRHPTQIYEAMGYIALHIFLILYYRRNVTKLKDGIMSGIFLIGLFGSRFFVEFLKVEQEDFEKGMLLNMGQLLSIPFILLGIYFIVIGNRREPKNYLVNPEMKDMG